LSVNSKQTVLSREPHLKSNHSVCDQRAKSWMRKSAFWQLPLQMRDQERSIHPSLLR